MRNKLFSAIVCLLIVLLSSPATATDYTWDNSTGDSQFSTASNWDPLSGPPDSDDRAIFDSVLMFDTVNVAGGTQIDTMRVTLNAVVNLDIDGTMDLLAVTNQYGLIVGDASGDDSTLNLQTGILSNSGWAIIGNASGSQGEVTVDDSTWTNIDLLHVGYYGTGELNITGGGQVSNTDGYVGTYNGSNGTVTVSGTDGGGTASTWTNSGLLFVGYQGTGRLDITGGGQVSSLDGGVGVWTATTGTVTIDGQDSYWEATRNLWLGDNSTNGVGTVELKGTSTTGARLYVGDGAKAAAAGYSGTMIVVSDAQSDEGKLEIYNGSELTNPGWAAIGADAGEYGTVKVSDAGSTWDNSKDLSVGYFGIGTLDIYKGGQVIVPDGNGRVGEMSASKGTVTVDGTDSTWEMSYGGLYVGEQGTGTLDITGGGLVSITQQAHIGSNGGSEGTVTVSGSDGGGNRSTWEAPEPIHVGEYGIGTLNILDGGLVDNQYGSSNVGTMEYSVGIATVDGTDGSGNASTWDHSNGILFVGAAGEGKLNITDGGNVVSASGEVGHYDTGRGTVTIDGEDSYWNVRNSLELGRNHWLSGIGTIELEETLGTGARLYVGSEALAWGTVFSGTAIIVSNASPSSCYLSIYKGSTLTNPGLAVIGAGAGQKGTVQVHGTGSKWTNTGGLTVGEYGTGDLFFTNGGLVASATGYVGYYSGSNGTVTVSGTDSTWDNTGDLYVGGRATAAGGTASVSVWDNASLEVGGTLKIWGPGSVFLDGGNIDGHNVEVEGELIGNGSIFLGSGPTEVTNRGLVAPGLSAGMISIYGGNSTVNAYVQEASGLLSIEIGGTNPSEYDQLEIVNGSAALDGTLEVTLIEPSDGGGIFTPSVGDRFDILLADHGLDGTEFATLLVSTTLPGLAWGIDYGLYSASLEIFLDADFDHDGDVDGGDFLVWQRGVGTSIPKHSDGDADNDGDVDGDDLALWNLSFGNVASVVPASAAVPEPASAPLMLLAALGLCGFRRLRRSLGQAKNGGMGENGV